jgi:hypothetical protein
MTRGVWGPGPWTARWGDYLNRIVTVSVFYDETTLAIVNPGLTGNREVGCVYDRVVIGQPGAGQKVFLIPEGDFAVSRVQLSNFGFDDIEALTSANFTLGVSETPT